MFAVECDEGTYWPRLDAASVEIAAFVEVGFGLGIFSGREESATDG